LEARGRNWREHEYADADGLRCSGERIDPSGEDYHEVDPSPIYLGRWLERCGVHTEVSTDANAFICNALLYELAELARNRGVPFAYAHVPFTERYQDVPVDRPRILQAELELAVEVILISLYRYYHEKS
jgi:pyrrolidone-carboxylate peptidase